MKATSTAKLKNINREIRERAVKKDVALWEVAERFNLSAVYFYTILRKEFTAEMKRKALNYIDMIAEERTHAENEK